MSQLGDFLRARRALVDPASLGLPEYGRRRSPGLRREELALLAGVSAAYYARLEQGRDQHPSPQVLDALATALELDDELRAHLHQLAEPEPATRRPRPRRPERLSHPLALLMEQWAASPALVVGRHRDVLAATPVAVLVSPGFAAGRNLVHDVFLDEEVRASYVGVDEVAKASVAGLRASVGADLDDPRLTELVGELSLKSAEFRRLWARHDVRVKTTGVKVFETPLVGRLSLAYQSFSVHGADQQSLYVYLAEPGTPDERALQLLTGLAAPAAQPDRASVSS